ncbi:hypothetical protein [Rariglobus hedericola]|uniref:Uncharacterized protein n=1 Tax=Rariglobus hedericola TaxID=2597822 RepID=A0A556QPR8_9BACT|nr:hypothetical protein [Rariglobus hedericola]TSJ78635.1 hypothetical protein FPL22_04845 [Rariglobus hedericola]
MKSFLSNRAQHDQPSLGRETASGEGLARLQHAHSGPADRAASAAGHSVECVKDGDKVVRLIVTCSCGERIEVDCLYPSTS